MAVHQPSELYWTVSTIQLVRTRTAKTGELLEADKGAFYLVRRGAHLIAATGASKIVAFALGDLNYVSSNSRWGLSIVKRYMTQHAFLLTLREFFACLIKRQKGEKDAAPEYEVPYYAQEPRYCNNDKQPLEKNFIQVLDNPKGFLEVGESSIVVLVAPNIAVREIVTDIARPAVLIWDFVGFDTELWVHIPQPTIYNYGRFTFCMNEADRPSSRVAYGTVREVDRTDPVSARVKRMIRDEYVSLEFPECTHFSRGAGANHQLPRPTCAILLGAHD